MYKNKYWILKLLAKLFFELDIPDAPIKEWMGYIGITGGIKTFFLDKKEFNIYERYLEETVIPHIVAVNKAAKRMAKVFDLGDNFIEQVQTHDLSKFSTEEFIYCLVDFKEFDNNPDEIKEYFKVAWHHHKMHNPHHPEHWFNISKEGDSTPMDMPFPYIIEMLADWIGAGEVYGNPVEDWVKSNIDNFVFSENTAKTLQQCLHKLEWGTFQLLRVGNNRKGYVLNHFSR